MFPINCKNKQSGGRNRKLHLAVGLACLLVGGCSHSENFAYHATDDIPQGPGAISDESGAFTLFEWKEGEDQTASKKSSIFSAPDPEPVQTQAVVSSSGITESATPE